MSSSPIVFTSSYHRDKANGMTNGPRVDGRLDVSSVKLMTGSFPFVVRHLFRWFLVLGTQDAKKNETKKSDLLVGDSLISTERHPHFLK